MRLALKKRKEGNVLFNDALNTFIYGYMASYIWKRITQKAREETRCCHMSSKGFYMHHPTDRITHTMAFVTPVMEHWLERDF